jgi:murein DD-endopeptidase MepM/ murein hydrolase activator NlpD
MSRIAGNLPIVVLCVTALVRSAEGQSFAVGFPVPTDRNCTSACPAQNPYAAQIITVIDHSADYFYDTEWKEVVAYTGEKGQAEAWLPNGGCGPSNQPCGYYNPNFSSGHPVQFITNGSYKGNAGPPPSGDSPYQLNVLNYRGHPGYDYSYGLGTAIIAAQDGTLYIPASDPVDDFGGTDPWCKHHAFYIIDDRVPSATYGWATWYLHADKLTIGTPHLGFKNATGTDCPNGMSSNISSDERIAPVNKGDQVAVVGGWEKGSPVGVGYHLHFEVRRGCEGPPISSVRGCKDVDPYGWEWPGGDPIDGNHCYKAIKTQPSVPCTGAQAAPLWRLADWNLQQPVVTSINLVGSPGSYTATITGQNFSTSPLVTLWDGQRQYCNDIGQLTCDEKMPTQCSAPCTQIVVQLPISSPNSYVLKVRNPNGPRSVGVPLSPSVQLVINGASAPGGGTFAGFSGFWSTNNRGETVFSAGVDTTGNGTPTYFGDFEFSAGQITKPTVPAFTTISSVASHIRLNNRGDMAFGDVNGIYGGLPAGIYTLTAGSTTPTPVVKWGQACPSPCPVSGSPTISQLFGPLAFSDGDDVAFAASLLSPQTNIGACCFLFLYSGADGSIVKVAADGPSGDMTPVGGTFASGTLNPPITQITSDGDVVFLAQVIGGTSPGGIFRFSAVSRNL